MTNTKFLHEQVYEDIKLKITEELYPANSILPKEIELAKIYKVSRHTIRKAMDQLNHDGFIRKVKGTGTFVNVLKADYALSNMSSFSEIIKSHTGHPNSIVLSANLTEVDKSITNKLGLLENDRVYLIERIRKNGDINLCYEITYISPKHCPDIDKFVSPNASLYDLYENKYNLELDEGHYRLEAINVDERVSKLLDIPKLSSVLFMRALIHLKNGSPLYYVKGYYIGSRYIFSTTLKR